MTTSGYLPLVVPHRLLSSTQTLPTDTCVTMPQKTADLQSESFIVSDDPHDPPRSGIGSPIPSVAQKLPSSFDTLPTVTSETLSLETSDLEGSIVSDNAQDLPGPSSVRRLQYSRKELCDLNHSSPPSLNVLQVLQNFNLARFKVSLPKVVTFAAVLSGTRAVAANTAEPAAEGRGLADKPDDSGTESRVQTLATQSSLFGSRSSSTTGNQNTGLSPSQLPSLQAQTPARKRGQPAVTGVGSTTVKERESGIPETDRGSSTSSRRVSSIATQLDENSSPFFGALARARAIAAKISLPLSLRSTGAVGRQPQDQTECSDSPVTTHRSNTMQAEASPKEPGHKSTGQPLLSSLDDTDISRDRPERVASRTTAPYRQKALPALDEMSLERKPNPEF